MLKFALFTLNILLRLSCRAAALVSIGCYHALSFGNFVCISKCNCGHDPSILEELRGLEVISTWGGGRLASLPLTYDAKVLNYNADAGFSFAVEEISSDELELKIEGGIGLEALRAGFSMQKTTIDDESSSSRTPYFYVGKERL